MLPKPFLQSKRDGARLTPAWLAPEHDAWLDAMIEALAACEGIPSAEADAHVETLALDARKRGVARATVAGVWHVLRSFSRTEVDARVAPRELRSELFSVAASVSIDAALARGCAKHEVTADCLRAWLYADIPSARVVRVEELPSASKLRGDYNIALAQGLLAQCAHVTITSVELRSMVRAAKLRGLLVAIDAEGPTLRASGPLSLLRQTRKYAHALASFLPALVTGAPFTLEGKLEDGGVLHIDDSSPLPKVWPIPARADTLFDRTLRAFLARSATGWSIRHEATVLRSEGELVFPDFVLERGLDRVLVEMVGFWTPDYLERKLARLATVIDAPMIVCVDETLACDSARLANADVLRFRRRLDPVALLEAAERAVRRPKTGDYANCLPPRG